MWHSNGFEHFRRLDEHRQADYLWTCMEYAGGAYKAMLAPDGLTDGAGRAPSAKACSTSPGLDAMRAAVMPQLNEFGALHLAFSPRNVERQCFCFMCRTRAAEFAGARAARDHQTAAFGADRSARRLKTPARSDLWGPHSAFGHPKPPG